MEYMSNLDCLNRLSEWDEYLHLCMVEAHRDVCVAYGRFYGSIGDVAEKARLDHALARYRTALRRWQEWRGGEIGIRVGETERIQPKRDEIEAWRKRREQDESTEHNEGSKP